jgi:5-(carboxyamino)imidazole ribonucleotide mutase
MVAAKTTIPVLGVPIPTRQLKGMDSLLSIVQMPKGVPVATFAIGEAGAANAGLFAVSLLSVAQDGDAPRYQQQLDGFRTTERDRVLALTLEDPA